MQSPPCNQPNRPPFLVALYWGLWSAGAACVGTMCSLFEVTQWARPDVRSIVVWFFPPLVAWLTVACYFATRRFAWWHVPVLSVFAAYEVFGFVYLAGEGERIGFHKVLEVFPAAGQILVLPVLWYLARRLNNNQAAAPRHVSR